ncbi:hypothetical protein PCANC_20427 [Puccinia coronata f. sp. avenae]|uniref:BED-type domain-containing protein n=1 Tax=Puccinia coronata f. sp. avenae TaxID=200324 RepID=A0A2N5SEC4_9BASI|nr:hypothetical protein PCANC_20427 [Puccinia coronata f. sp. avenae]
MGRNKDAETIKQTQPDVSSTQEEQPAKKCKTTSDIWTYFTKTVISPKDGKPKDVKATCKYFKAVLEGKSINGTNHLWRHLNQCASYITKNKQSLLKLVANKGGSQAASWVFCRQTSRKILITMIIAHKHPFTFVEQPLFKAFVGSLQPRFKLFSRATIKNNIMKLFYTMKGKLLADIAKFNCVALTTNLWTSSNQSPYMVVSCHYVFDDWTLQQRLISFKELPSPHTGLAIAEQLISTIVEWKIINKVTFITVDNASSNDVAVTCLASVLESCSTRTPDMNAKYFHVCCLAHIINLIVKDGLGTLSPAISKIRDSVCYTKSLSSRKQLFREAIDEANLKDQALPSVDVPTRWNSTFLMLKLAIPYRNAFKNLALNNANFTLNLTAKEWDEILMMKDFLEIFHKATLGLGATREPTAQL